MSSSDVSKPERTLTPPVNKLPPLLTFPLQRWRGILALITLIFGIGVGYLILVLAISSFVNSV